MGKADPKCPYCHGRGKRKTWEVDPKTDQYDWIEIKCECTE